MKDKYLILSVLFCTDSQNLLYILGKATGSIVTLTCRAIMPEMSWSQSFVKVCMNEKNAEPSLINVIDFCLQVIKDVECNGRVPPITETDFR